jgi:hypothetical protein
MTRKERRAMRRDQIAQLRLDCAECGAEVAPQRIEDTGVGAIYFAQCSCGTLLCGVIGPPEAVLAFQASVQGLIEGKGQKPPEAIFKPLPAGWMGDGPTP